MNSLTDQENLQTGNIEKTTLKDSPEKIKKKKVLIEKEFLEETKKILESLLKINSELRLETSKKIPKQKIIKRANVEESARRILQRLVVKLEKKIPHLLLSGRNLSKNQIENGNGIKLKSNSKNENIDIRKSNQKRSRKSLHNRKKWSKKQLIEQNYLAPSTGNSENIVDNCNRVPLKNSKNKFSGKMRKNNNINSSRNLENRRSNVNLAKRRKNSEKKGRILNENTQVYDQSNNNNEGNSVLLKRWNTERTEILAQKSDKKREDLIKINTESDFIPTDSNNSKLIIHKFNSKTPDKIFTGNPGNLFIKDNDTVKILQEKNRSEVLIENRRHTKSDINGVETSPKTFSISPRVFKIKDNISNLTPKCDINFEEELILREPRTPQIVKIKNDFIKNLSEVSKIKRSSSSKLKSKKFIRESKSQIDAAFDFKNIRISQKIFKESVNDLKIIKRIEEKNENPNIGKTRRSKSEINFPIETKKKTFYEEIKYEEKTSNRRLITETETDDPEIYYTPEKSENEENSFIEKISYKEHNIIEKGKIFDTETKNFLKEEEEENFSKFDTIYNIEETVKSTHLEERTPSEYVKIAKEKIKKKIRRIVKPMKSKNRKDSFTKKNSNSKLDLKKQVLSPKSQSNTKSKKGENNCTKPPKGENKMKKSTRSMKKCKKGRVKSSYSQALRKFSSRVQDLLSKASESAMKRKSKGALSQRGVKKGLVQTKRNFEGERVDYGFDGDY